MLCCGLIALVAAAGLGLWRWLRGLPRLAVVVGAGMLAAAGLASWSLAAAAGPGRAVEPGWMGVICGARGATAAGALAKREPAEGLAKFRLP